MVGAPVAGTGKGGGIAQGVTPSDTQTTTYPMAGSCRRGEACLLLSTNVFSTPTHQLHYLLQWTACMPQ